MSTFGGYRKMDQVLSTTESDSGIADADALNAALVRVADAFKQRRLTVPVAVPLSMTKAGPVAWELAWDTENDEQWRLYIRSNPGALYLLQSQKILIRLKAVKALPRLFHAAVKAVQDRDRLIPDATAAALRLAADIENFRVVHLPESGEDE